MKKFTVEDVISLGPCQRYLDNDAALLHTLFAGRKTLTLADVVDMPDVPPEDAVWLATQIFTPEENVYFAVKCATDAGLSAHDAAGHARYYARHAGYAAAAAHAARYAGYAAGHARYAARYAGYAARERQVLFIAEVLLGQ